MEVSGNNITLATTQGRGSGETIFCCFAIVERDTEEHRDIRREVRRRLQAQTEAHTSPHDDTIYAP